MPHKHLLKALLIGLSFSYPLCADATKNQLMNDLSLPIEIQSDVATFEHALEQAVYEGNVVMTQGSHTLHADKLLIQKNTEDGTSCFIATGTPATFKGLVADSPVPVSATAKTITFHPESQLLVFEEDATLNHQQDKFKGPSLSYRLDTQTITANANGHVRPTITIQPRRQS